MANTKQQILKSLKQHLHENYGESIKDVILFGSRTKHHASEYSDYDILIVLKNEYSGQDENKILDLCYDIDLEYNILIDVHLISEKELNTARGKQPIFANAIESGIYA